MNTFTWRGFFPVILLFLIFCSLCPKLLLAQKAGFPAQELETLDGSRTAIRPDTSAAYTVLDFWALWCAPCLVALPEIDGLARKMEGRPVRFILVNCDNTRSRAKVRSYIRSKVIKAQVLLDPSAGLLRYYGIATLPHLVVLDSLGNVADRKSGYMPGDELQLEKKLDNLLEK